MDTIQTQEMSEWCWIALACSISEVRRGELTSQEDLVQSLYGPAEPLPNLPGDIRDALGPCSIGFLPSNAPMVPTSLDDLSRWLSQNNLVAMLLTGGTGPSAGNHYVLVDTVQPTPKGTAVRVFDPLIGYVPIDELVEPPPRVPVHLVDFAVLSGQGTYLGR